MVCAISLDREPKIVKEHIYPDLKHWDTVVPKLKAFWRVCILPEILGQWYTRKCTLPINNPNDNGVMLMTLLLLVVTQSVHMDNFIHHVWLLALLRGPKHGTGHIAADCRSSNREGGVRHLRNREHRQH